ncbi:MAG: glutathione S-transferase family protein [Pseudomonadota bacterium]|jgi:glutathione S-transferase|uniref:Glutathione S-transferase family protein n=1 Tax=Qipengyuania pelagi TaxID=994320 RepID=A0A844YAH2_9SPHN|nr:glutathione S-transferase family protein [Qipengyuania pelagi]MEC7399167.1 glutathione S-transferase family protein [Pseudomonadota bacterium]MEC7817460.1 glutathione S-transferase family protein [Pseudomonadota bacterium]MXO54419.1 glutathione S-transferase family protein [Qipengyuania pelagi]
MWTLHQFPLCPFSRKVRILLGEKSIAYDLVQRRPWDEGDDLWRLNDAGRVPVLEDKARNIALCDSRAICEYLEETVERSPMLAGSALARAETRRLVALFEENFHADVVAPLLHEKMTKRLVLRQPPDGRVLREAMKRAHGHLDYIDWLVDNRSWLAGSTMSLADLAAAAQVSVADYLGGIDWRGHDQARGWYAVFKSRPSFRPLLAEKMEGIHPPSHYAMVDG